MIKIIYVLLAFFITTSVFAQNFEGEIVYKNSYKSKIPNVKDDQLQGMLGGTQNYFIKGSNYKSVLNGTLMQWQLYINKDNKLYNKMATSETILWSDGAINTDTIIKSELKKGTAKVLGYTCDEVVLTCKSGVQHYYFNAVLKVDPALYIHHNYGNWYAYLLKANALPLKVTMETPQFNFESVATAIKQMVLKATIFELPEGVKTMKNPS